MAALVDSVTDAEFQVGAVLISLQKLEFIGFLLIDEKFLSPFLIIHICICEIGNTNP